VRLLTSWPLYVFAGLAILAIGLHTFVSARHLLRRLLAFNIMGSGTFLVLVGLPYHERGPDAVPQALVLTGIVVAVASTALALLLLRRWVSVSGAPRLPEDSAGESS
jgi:multicomponent Na+:H+ antiporter subunit C